MILVTGVAAGWPCASAATSRCAIREAPASCNVCNGPYTRTRRQHPLPSFFQAKSKLSQIRASSSKARTKYSKGNPWISFAELSLIKALRRPPGPFFIFAPLPALKEATGRRRRCPFAWGSCVFLGLHFEFVLAFSSEVKGWRLFHDRGRSGVFVRLGGRGADEREKGTPASTDPGTYLRGPGPRGKRQADRSDVRQEFARKGPEPVSSPMDKRTGASPSCRECLLNPCLLMLPFRFAHARRMRPLSVGRLDNAFHPATGSPYHGSAFP